MSYARQDAQETERNTLAARLAETRQALAAQGALREQERVLVKDLDAVPAAHPNQRARAVLPSGVKVSIASPCSEDWSRMTGDEFVRHCSKCDKKVYDLSGLQTREIEALLMQHGEAPCVRFFKRKDGTVMTADCPVGRPKRVALRVLTALGLSGLAAGAAYEVYEATRPPAIMGAFMPMSEPVEVMGAMPIQEVPTPDFAPRGTPTGTPPIAPPITPPARGGAPDRADLETEF